MASDLVEDQLCIRRALKRMQPVPRTRKRSREFARKCEFAHLIRSGVVIVYYGKEHWPWKINCARRWSIVNGDLQPCDDPAGDASLG